MSTLVQISVLPRQQEDEPFIKELALTKAKLYANDISQWRIRKRSIDARRVPIKINLHADDLRHMWLIAVWGHSCRRLCK